MRHCNWQQEVAEVGFNFIVLHWQMYCTADELKQDITTMCFYSNYGLPTVSTAWRGSGSALTLLIVFSTSDPVGVVARLSVSPRHSARDGAIWFLTTFANTIGRGLRSWVPLLVIAQHSEPIRKIGRMQVLYNFSLVGMVILDFQICSSRFCIAAWVMALRLDVAYLRLCWRVEILLWVYLFGQITYPSMCC